LPAKKHCNTFSEDVESCPMFFGEFTASVSEGHERVKEMGNAEVDDCVLHL